MLTPLAYGDDEAVLIVNRGWIERTGDDFDVTLRGEPRAFTITYVC